MPTVQYYVAPGYVAAGYVETRVVADPPVLQGAQSTQQLAPLANSYVADALEADLKALFMSLFETFIRSGERAVNSSGFPQQSAIDQFERAVKSDGMAMIRRSNDNTMRYLFRAWKARNPGRGLHMLRAYLQLLWPNGWEMYQQWHHPTTAYPTALSDTQVPGYFLTSRIKVSITSSDSSGTDVVAVTASLRSVLAARFLLQVQLLSRSSIGSAMAAGMGHTLYHDISGAFT